MKKSLFILACTNEDGDFVSFKLFNTKKAAIEQMEKELEIEMKDVMANGFDTVQTTSTDSTASLSYGDNNEYNWAIIETPAPSDDEAQSEFINRVELRGVVGMAKASDIGGRRLVRFSIMTDMAKKASDGRAYIETTWHNCSAWEGPGVTTAIDKGMRIAVTGRIRCQNYIAVDGQTRNMTEILCDTLEILSE